MLVALGTWMVAWCDAIEDMDGSVQGQLHVIRNQFST